MPTCVQIPFYITYSEELAPSPDPWPAGSNESLPFSQQGMNWAHDWIYRRVQAGANASASRPAPGEVSVINVGHGDDYDNGYVARALLLWLSRACMCCPVPADIYFTH